jgi:hypothetical protein
VPRGETYLHKDGQTFVTLRRDVSVVGISKEILFTISEGRSGIKGVRKNNITRPVLNGQ